MSLSPYSPGTYVSIPVLAGGCYSVSTCGAPFDTQINCFQGNTTTAPFAYDDDSGPLCGGLAASVTMVPNFTDYARLDIRQYACQPGGSSSITVTLQQNNNLSITSSSASMCQGQSRTLSAVPVPVTGAQPGSGSSGTFSGTGVSGSTFTAPIPGSASQSYIITYTFGYVSTTQGITVFHAPTTSNAGQDQTVCVGSATLQGNTPTFGTGQWTTTSPGVTITSPTSANSGVTGLQPGTSAVFRWVISNGVCSSSMDSVVITRDEVPTPANAGNDLGVCNDSIFLGGNTPSVGTGVWSVIAGGSNVMIPSNPNSMVTGLSIGTNTLVWTTSNGVCPSTSDTMSILRDAQAPQPFAGPDKMICESQTSLTGNIPPIGVGVWTVISGSGVITSPNSPNSMLTGVNVGTSVLTWSITNGTCPPRFDTLLVVRSALPTAPTVAGNNAVCYGESATVTANTSAPNPTIIWWDSATGGNVLAAGPSYTTPPITTSLSVYAEVTDGNTNCTSPRTQHAITVNALPNVGLGSDRVFCASDSTCLDAGPGMASYQWNTGSTARILCTNVSGIYWVEVTDNNGCHGADTIQLTANTPPTVNLGPDITLCAGNQTNLSVPSVGTQSYLWSTGSTSNNITVTTGGTYTITVTDANGCESSDAVVVTSQALPVAAFSVNTSGCPNIVFTDLSTDSDTWLWTFGNSTSSSLQNPTATYTANGSYTVTLVSSSQCGSDNAQQVIDISCLVGVTMPDNLAITVYPNPNDGIFKIHFEGLEQNCMLNIFNELGQEVYAKDIEACGGTCDEVVDISQAATGIYFAKMRIGDVSLTKRVIVR